MGALETHYEVVGRILVHMASIGLKRIEAVNHSNVFQLFGTLTDSTDADRIAYQDVLEWMFSEGLLRSARGGSKRESVFNFDDVQLTAKGSA